MDNYGGRGKVIIRSTSRVHSVLENVYTGNTSN